MNQTQAKPLLNQLSSLAGNVTFHTPDKGFYAVHVKVHGERDLISLSMLNHRKIKAIHSAGRLARRYAQRLVWTEGE